MAIVDLPRFYSDEASSNKMIVLIKDEAHHLNVLRLGKGDVVHVLDGRGKLFEAEVVHAKRAELSIGKVLLEEVEPHASILLVAPTKNMSRFEWVIEKATELGVGRIIPIHCEHSERVQLKQERLLRIALSAAKQSKDLFIPQIDALTPFEKAVETEAAARWIAHCGEGERSPLTQVVSSAQRTLIAIGPEGDFSANEVSIAIEHGYTALSLGEKRLRTETAAISAAMAMTIFSA